MMTSAFRLMSLTLSVPDHSTVSRRAVTLPVIRPALTTNLELREDELLATAQAEIDDVLHAALHGLWNGDRTLVKVRRATAAEAASWHSSRRRAIKKGENAEEEGGPVYLVDVSKPALVDAAIKASQIGAKRQAHAARRPRSRRLAGREEEIDGRAMTPAV